MNLNNSLKYFAISPLPVPMSSKERRSVLSVFSRRISIIFIDLFRRPALTTNPLECIVWFKSAMLYSFILFSDCLIHDINA